jgi:ABC-type multidrug transport system fused ATPase/permease subunit
MLRFYKPTNGEIFFDGLPASEYEVISLRRRIGYVSQQPRLLAGSILENLRYGNPDADEAKVKQAAKIAGLHDFFESLTDGYDTEIGENGIKLSEGQKQRMSIVRALIKDPDILVLDEPTAALDHDTEMSLFDALPEMFRQKTLLVVSHRSSTIRRAERILLLNENQLIDIGTHQSLLDSNTYYREMIARQNQENKGLWKFRNTPIGA